MSTLASFFSCAPSETPTAESCPWSAQEYPCSQNSCAFLSLYLVELLNWLSVHSRKGFFLQSHSQYRSRCQSKLPINSQCLFLAGTLSSVRAELIWNKPCQWSCAGLSSVQKQQLKGPGSLGVSLAVG